MFSNYRATPLIALSLLLGASLAQAATLPTLYAGDIHHGTFMVPLDMSQHGLGYTISPETRISAVKTSDTYTVYEVLEVGKDMSYDVDVDPGNQFRLSKVPIPGVITYTYTILEGASTVHIDAPPAVITTAAVPLNIEGVSRDCTLDRGKKTGTCVDERRLPVLVTITDPAAPATITSTTTYGQTYTMALERMIFTATSGVSGMTEPSTLVCTLVISVVLVLGIAAQLV